MKLWHVAALLAVLGIAYVLIRRPTLPASAGTSPSTSNAQFVTSLIGLGTKLLSTPKATPPSAVVDAGADQGTFNQGPSDVEGNTLVNDSGDTLTYGTD